MLLSVCERLRSPARYVPRTRRTPLRSIRCVVVRSPLWSAVCITAQEHRPYGITAACVLPNGVKVSAGADGELNAFNPNNLAQFTTRVLLRPDGTERVTML